MQEQKLVLQVNEVFKKFGNLEVLKGVNVTVERGSIVSIVGPSGAGKSTLLHVMGTLETADKGEIIINGQNTGNLNRKQISGFRNRQIGFIFQFHHLLPEFTALQNVMLPAMIAGKTTAEAEQAAGKWLDLLGLEDRKRHKPAELSGGEQQRTAVARALINNPSIILADEPSGNLDSVNARELHELFFSLRDKTGQTFVIVTHNNELAEMVDKKLMMKDGKII
ncbi:MAG: ABC transporter ATP-binding protein [Bacteroidia bacterium]|nr:ABC transporter ATP-binding protein [Bacteroidia bacterium]MCZ2277122.1 ABC transporter ATP-binding protein [Bacteroidia bacterium]